MNKDTPVIEIETQKVLNKQFSPYALQLDDLSKRSINKWIIDRATPFSRKNADKIYKTVNLSRDNQEIELMYLTHSLSINDNYWIASEKEINTLKYENISLFRNSFNEAMYLVALKGNDGFTLTDGISPEYTGQGTFPKCFVRKQDGIYMYKSGSTQDIRNEVFAGYIADLLGANTIHYEYESLENIPCTVSKIYTNENINWETAFILCEFLSQTKYTPQSFSENFLTKDYVNMIILDAVILNDDRHMKNWSVQFEADTNNIMGLAPNYDYNNAFRADDKTISNLMFDYRGKKVNILKAARIAYQKYGSTLRLDFVKSVINNINIDINKSALINRINYIQGFKDNQKDCC